MRIFQIFFLFHLDNRTLLHNDIAIIIFSRFSFFLFLFSLTHVMEKIDFSCQLKTQYSTLFFTPIFSHSHVTSKMNNRSNLPTVLLVLTINYLCINYTRCTFHQRDEQMRHIVSRTQPTNLLAFMDFTYYNHAENSCSFLYSLVS